MSTVEGWQFQNQSNYLRLQTILNTVSDKDASYKYSESSNTITVMGSSDNRYNLLLELPTSKNSECDHNSCKVWVFINFW